MLCSPFSPLWRQAIEASKLRVEEQKALVTTAEDGRGHRTGRTSVGQARPAEGGLQE